MRVSLYDGSKEISFFLDPKRLKWERQKGEYVRCHYTGEAEPFNKVFIKRLHYKPEAHNLLVKLVGKSITGTPKVFGYTQEGRKYLYFFEYLDGYDLLHKQLTGIHCIRREILIPIIRHAANVFEAISHRGYVYIDFCSKNIMHNDANNKIAIIDMDSSWPIERLRIQQPTNRDFTVVFWELWKHVCQSRIIRPEEAAKTVVLSFGAVWSRAIMLASRPTDDERLAALRLVRNPVDSEQLPLWNALENQDRQGFMEYFKLSESKDRAVYNQWQRMFDDLQKGQELSWDEIISASENLLDAICGVQKPQKKPAVHDLTWVSSSYQGSQGAIPVHNLNTTADPVAPSLPVASDPSKPHSWLRIRKGLTDLVRGAAYRARRPPTLLPLRKPK